MGHPVSSRVGGMLQKIWFCEGCGLRRVLLGCVMAGLGVSGLGVSGLMAQRVAHRTAVVKTAQVDLSYETFGSRSAGLPIIAINGGPGLSHAYMVENDIWERIARHRLVGVY